MKEQKGGRWFGTGTFLGKEGASFFDKPLSDRVIEMGWSHACPVIDEVIREYGPEWTLKRYAECNFVFGLIAESARDLNPGLYIQLTSPVRRSKGEKPGRDFNREYIPGHFYKRMSPLSTPWGYALPRVIIEEMGRGENNEDRTQTRILKALNIINLNVQISRTPIQLLVKTAEQVSRLDADPKIVLSHVFASGILKEEGCRKMFEKIRHRMELTAPLLTETYCSMPAPERERLGIIDFDN